MMFSFRNPSKLSLLLLSVFFKDSLAQPSLQAPLPNGAYNTTFSTMKLVDHDRLDPFAETPQPRALMISLFHPAKCDATQLTDYAPPATAAFTDKLLNLPDGTMESFKIQVCDKNALGRKRHSSLDPDFPVVLFSHGLTGSRHWYNSLGQWVAGHGYNVVMIDHPYDASIVEFPDGTVIHGVMNETSGDPELAIDVRKKDAKFVLDKMENPLVVGELIPGVECGLNVDQSAIFGHSLGGATAPNAMGIDSRLKGGINLDGTMYGPARDEDLMRPFIIFGTETHDRTNDPSWATFWSHLLGWRKGFIYQGATHLTYTDGPIWADLAGIDRGDLPPGYDIGEIGGLRNLEILSAYVNAFLDFALKEYGDGLPTGSYPEISDDF